MSNLSTSGPTYCGDLMSKIIKPLFVVSVITQFKCDNTV